MKPSHKPNRRALVLIMGTLLAVVGAANLSFTVTSLPGSIWNQLGISEKTGTENIRKSFIEGYMYTYGSAAARKIAVGDRVGVANDVMSYAKTYVTTPAFQQAYQEAREQQKPVPPPPAKSKEQVQAEQIASMEKVIAETEKSMKAMSAEMQESMKDALKSFHEQLEDYKKPDNEILKYMADGEKFTYDAAMKTYEANMATWEKSYPENYKLMVKDRLEKFLTITADVDYNATVHEQYGLKKFDNTAYERKPDEWKMAYRAGKPVVDSAREFANAWLRELK